MTAGSWAPQRRDLAPHLSEASDAPSSRLVGTARAAAECSRVDSALMGSRCQAGTVTQTES